MKRLSVKHFAIAGFSLLASPALAGETAPPTEEATISTCKGYGSVYDRAGKKHKVLIVSDWQRKNREIREIIYGGPQDIACSKKQTTLEDGAVATISASNPTGAHLIANHFKATHDGETHATAPNSRPASPDLFIVHYSPE